MLGRDRERVVGLVPVTTIQFWCGKRERERDREREREREREIDREMEDRERREDRECGNRPARKLSWRESR